MPERVHDDVRGLPHTLLVHRDDSSEVGGALRQVLDEQVQLPGGLIEVADAGGAVRHRHVEDLLHAAVEAGHALQVECLRRLVDHRAVGHRVGSDCGEGE